MISNKIGVIKKKRHIQNSTDVGSENHKAQLKNKY
jgi:hypothetical protein